VVIDRPINLHPDLFLRILSVAYAILGSSDGVTGAKCRPPKGEYRSVYLSEYRAGMKRKAEGNVGRPGTV